VRKELFSEIQVFVVKKGPHAVYIRFQTVKIS